MISFIALSAYILLLTGEISFGQQAFFAIGAYAAGIATAMWGWGFWPGLAWGAAAAGAGAFLLAWPTLRMRGLFFAIGTLAFAEMVRLLFEIFTYQVEIDGELVGPNGSEGFRGIRYIFEQDISAFHYMLLIYALLAGVLVLLFVIERTRLGAIWRMLGEDDLLAEMQGVNRTYYKVLATVFAGAVAGIGGGLYAHMNTYLEPKIFNVMLGVHSLAYGLIGGLGTAFGPLIGVAIDIGLLESARIFSGYRMIVFGGIVALLLIFRPRGLLDETAVHAIAAWWRKLILVAPANGPARLVHRSNRVLEVERVSRSFGGVAALSEVDLRVAAGEVVGLIGPNGSGKTTLLNVITGLTPAERGRVRFDGRDVTNLRPDRIALSGACPHLPDPAHPPPHDGPREPRHRPLRGLLPGPDSERGRPRPLARAAGRVRPRGPDGRAREQAHPAGAAPARARPHPGQRPEAHPPRRAGGRDDPGRDGRHGEAHRGGGGEGDGPASSSSTRST